MPIETFGGIQELNPAFPPPSDGLVGGDDHIRGIKVALKASFPNITAPLSGSSEALNAAADQVASGSPKLADAGAMFNTNSRDGIKNPARGKVSIFADDLNATTPTSVAVAEFTGSDKKLKVLGPLQAVGPISGGTGQLVPIGGTLIWWEDTLPPEGGYAWANGAKVNVADCPVMASRAFWQARFTDGGTKIQLPDLREVTPVGNSLMGGTAARGIITNFTATVLSTIAEVFGAATHVLTTGQMPKHRHGAPIYDPGHAHGAAVVSGVNDLQYGGSFRTTPANGSTSASTTGVRVKSADGTMDATDLSGNDEAHNNVQPSAVVNWIIRVG